MLDPGQPLLLALLGKEAVGLRCGLHVPRGWDSLFSSPREHEERTAQMEHAYPGVFSTGA